jgi:hypothetical protein
MQIWTGAALRPLELEEEEQREKGLSEDEARYAARRAFGNRTLIRQQTHEVRGWAQFERFWQDLRYAGRVLVKNPGFSATAILVLALGIGASVAIFAFVDAALIKSLPFADPQRLAGLVILGSRSDADNGAVVVGKNVNATILPPLVTLGRAR